MSFILFIFLTAFMMEGIGSYISVIGLSALFASDWVIIAMALILDVAKITTVSFLYQYWYDVKALMKYYLLSSVLVLMLITSAGAFGYLSGAFQKAMAPNMEVTLKIESFKRERDGIIAEKAQLIEQRTQIDKQISQLPSESVKGRTRLINSFKPETERISSRIIEITKRSDQLTADILKVESQNIESSVHAGPITYISKAFNISIEEASKWIILTIIAVFDPLAVILIVAGNFLVKRRDDELAARPNEIQIEELPPSQPVISETVIDNLPSSSPEISSDHLLTELAPIDEVINEDQQAVESEETTEVIVSEAVTPEEQALFDLVYDANCHGEEPELIIDTDHGLEDRIQRSDLLEQLVTEYVPEVPDVETSHEIAQGDPSSLEDIKVNMPEALFRKTESKSSKRYIYENL